MVAIARGVCRHCGSETTFSDVRGNGNYCIVPPTASRAWWEWVELPTVSWVWFCNVCDTWNA